MKTILALYRGETISSARIVAVTTNPAIIAEVTSRLLTEEDDAVDADAVIEKVEQGRRKALRLIRRESKEVTKGQRPAPFDVCADERGEE